MDIKTLDEQLAKQIEQKLEHEYARRKELESRLTALEKTLGITHSRQKQ